MSEFQLVSDFLPTGDQPQAIDALTKGFEGSEREQILLGVTGSGKTFTMANVIARLGKPTLVVAHNKTLAAQLFNEFRNFFPHNAVEYFVSYYDYYQPEAYVPTTDTYIEKDSAINDELDRLRHSATRSALTRKDVIIVASVSSIYGLGSPSDYYDLHIHLERGQELNREELLTQLVRIQYRRNDMDLLRSTFRARGDVVEVIPAHEEDQALRVEFFGDEIDEISEIDPLRGTVLRSIEQVEIYPSSHYITPEERLSRAKESIEEELWRQVADLNAQGLELEAQRIRQRTLQDMEMLREVGYCHGIENYSRHLDGRDPGEAPSTLFSYLSRDHLVIVDESHQSIPQLRAMYKGDRSRKENLVRYGFRLPSAVDNRPLKFEEFEEQWGSICYISATPGPYELEKTGGVVVEQVLRPTGLVDPPVEIRPAQGQVDDLLGEVRKAVARGERILVTTLTKRFSEDLTEYYDDLGVRVRYLHSDIETLERVKIIRDLRSGEFDVLIGINLLREGLDLPEVALVAIFDADKEGFLRSDTSMIQTSGRAARHIDGRVIMYADRVTGSMQRALDEMSRRRTIQMAYNEENGITPRSISRSMDGMIESVGEMDYVDLTAGVAEEESLWDGMSEEEAVDLGKLREQMREAAQKLEFERAAELRDRIQAIERRQIGVLGGERVP
ncbi:MAG: excinuclease ABC subunit UvrB [Nitrospinaceae bacterium]|jgi:excinuclease ABC subunit B|nr:excinuclease ABC subunit UvrB [Nitrospinaceae bacterium]MBT4093035.1 excinuclease ABC subunit UvrB [Nitrospinaceae bacterium]MBT4429485.1 excinuclease ABC subunit UvrB [Nitrospinaceae bacterium]MBT5369976.1 excinuclease ABC subunit UvrB [Nitrospinaceae bacterium]MBT6393641.1 excinuclease ABC subunit UvrB [Nitrospinaceae bacterium]